MGFQKQIHMLFTKLRPPNQSAGSQKKFYLEGLLFRPKLHKPQAPDHTVSTCQRWSWGHAWVHSSPPEVSNSDPIRVGPQICCVSMYYNYTSESSEDWLWQWQKRNSRMISIQSCTVWTGDFLEQSDLEPLMVSVCTRRSNRLVFSLPSRDPHAHESPIVDEALLGAARELLASAGSGRNRGCTTHNRSGEHPKHT